MSRPVRICLVGGSGLVGSALIRACIGQPWLRLVAVARSELTLPQGARMEVLLADPANWGDAIAAARPDVIVSALGTTTKKVGGDEAAFRAVDHDLVLACARWGLDAGARQFIHVSSAMADAGSKHLYLRMKGETEQALAKLGYLRLDVIHPGLLLGKRGEFRPGERFAQIFAPAISPLMTGRWRKFKPVPADMVARAILALARQKQRGRFAHDYEGMESALRRLSYGQGLEPLDPAVE